MFTNKKLKTHKNHPVLGLNHCDADAASVTTNHRGVDVGSVYCNNTSGGTVPLRPWTWQDFICCRWLL